MESPVAVLTPPWKGSPSSGQYSCIRARLPAKPSVASTVTPAGTTRSWPPCRARDADDRCRPRRRSPVTGASSSERDVGSVGERPGAGGCISGPPPARAGVRVQPRHGHALAGHVDADVHGVAEVVGDPVHVVGRDRAERLDEVAVPLVPLVGEDVAGVPLRRVLDAGRALEAGTTGGEAAAGDRRRCSPRSCSSRGPRRRRRGSPRRAARS